LTTAHAAGAARAAAHDAESEAEDRVVDDSWRIHAQQLLSAGASAASARAKRMLRGAATAAIDAGIARLQRLRERTGDAKQPPERVDRDGERRAKRATAERPEDAVAEAVAPVPRRRVRRLFVYMSVMLAGGMGGSVLAYGLLAQLLDRQSAEIRRQEIVLSKLSKAAAESKNKLERQQAARIEADARLAAALAEKEKQPGDLQAKRVEAESGPVVSPAGRANNARPRDAGGERGSRAAARAGQPGWTGAGECTLGSGDVRSALKGCIAEMNRR
jgi:hypothetical protein